MVDTNGTPDDDFDSSATHRVRYDPAESANPSETLVVAIAEVADVDPLALDPLYETVDPELLDDVVSSGGSPDLDGVVSFTYAGYRVRVHASGLFEIAPDE